MIFYFIIIILILALFVFSNKKISPIPYYPTNSSDIPLVLKLFNLKNNQIIIDLGAGDGKIIFKTADLAYKKNLNTKFFAVEINPLLILIMHFKVFFHPNKKNIKIIFSDMFKLNLKKIFAENQSQITFYIYISPWYMKSILKNLKKQLKRFTIISYFYPVLKLRPKKVLSGKNKIYLYEVK